MFTVNATKNNDTFTETYSAYYQALTVAIYLQNSGYKVEISKN